MPNKKIYKQKLKDIDWSQNVQIFLADDSSIEATFEISMKIANWARQIESADKGNPALSFIRESQVCGQQTCALISLSLYKSSAALMRSMFESTLYYSYYRTHLSELSTLIRNTSFHTTKAEIIDFHKKHTIDFDKKQNMFNLPSRIQRWYSYTSSIIHGQKPGQWNNHISLTSIAHNQSILKECIETYSECSEIIHHFLLCTTPKDVWEDFSTDAKRKLLRGLTGEQKEKLGLDGS